MVVLVGMVVGSAVVVFGVVVVWGVVEFLVVVIVGGDLGVVVCLKTYVEMKIYLTKRRYQL